MEIQMNGIMDQIGALGGKISDALGLGEDKQPDMSQKLNELIKSSGGLGGLLGSAAVGGLIGTLFSGKSVRELAGGAVVTGGTAAAGVMAWKYIQKWLSDKSPADKEGRNPDSNGKHTVSGESGNSPEGESSPADSALLLLEAMIFAARADGEIDDEEKGSISKKLGSLFGNADISEAFTGLLNKPVDVEALARRVQSPEQGRDLYRLTCAVIDPDNEKEKAYLDSLAKALALSPEDREKLEKEGGEARGKAA